MGVSWSLNCGYAQQKVSQEPGQEMELGVWEDIEVPATTAATTAIRVQHSEWFILVNHNHCSLMIKPNTIAKILEHYKKYSRMLDHHWPL